MKPEKPDDKSNLKPEEMELYEGDGIVSAHDPELTHHSHDKSALTVNEAAQGGEIPIDVKLNSKEKQLEKRRRKIEFAKLLAMIDNQSPFDVLGFGDVRHYPPPENREKYQLSYMDVNYYPGSSPELAPLCKEFTAYKAACKAYIEAAHQTTEAQEKLDALRQFPLVSEEELDVERQNIRQCEKHERAMLRQKNMLNKTLSAAICLIYDYMPESWEYHRKIHKSWAAAIGSAIVNYFPPHPGKIKADKQRSLSQLGPPEEGEEQASNSGDSRILPDENKPSQKWVEHVEDSDAELNKSLKRLL